MPLITPRRVLGVWRDVAPYIGASTARLVGLSVTSLARGLAEAAVLVLVARIALGLTREEDRLGVSFGPFGTVHASIGTAIGVAMGLAVFMLALHVLSARLSAVMMGDALRHARERLASGFLDASWALQATERQGHLQEVMTTYAIRVSQGAAYISALTVALFNLGALVITAFVVDAQAAITLLVAVVLLAVAFRPLTRLTRRRSEAHRSANEDFATQVSEVVGVAEEIKTFHVGDAVLGRLRAAAEAASLTTVRVRFVGLAVAGIYQALAVMVVLAGLALVHFAGAGSTAALGAVVLLLIRSLSYGQQCQTSLNALGETAPYLRGVREQEAAYVEAAARGGTRALPPLRTLTFRDVSFTYEGHAEAIKNLTATIDHGTTVGLVGPSGSGKSTLVQILLRLRQPEEGEYLINDVPADEYVLDEWYRRLATVPQTPKVVEASVADNVRFFRDGITDEQVEEAVRAAHLHDEITDLPDGYQTVLRGIGGMISGGQAQRLCLARALVAEPSLIVLDEPTSSLDARSEALVQRTLIELKGSVTLLIIAHRMSTLRLCDRIMVLEEGTMQAFDTPERVLESDSFYREALELSRG